MILAVRCFIAYMAIAAALFSGTALAASLSGIEKSSRQAASPPAEPTEPGEVDAFMASLSDVQARKLLHDKQNYGRVLRKTGLIPI